MITPDQIEFREERSRSVPNATIITGRLLLHQSWMLDDYAPRCAKEDVKEYGYDRIRREIWHKIYGDLIKPVHELVHASQAICYSHGGADFQEVREKAEALLELLEYKRP